MARFFAGHVEESVTMPTMTHRIIRDWAIARGVTPADVLADLARDAAVAIVKAAGGDPSMVLAPRRTAAEEADEDRQRQLLGRAERQNRARIEWTSDPRHEILSAYGITLGPFPDDADAILVRHFTEAIRVLRIDHVLSDREIGELLGYSSTAVAIVRRGLGIGPIPSPNGKTYTGRPRTAA